jgi:hypothetical protein
LLRGFAGTHGRKSTINIRTGKIFSKKIIIILFFLQLHRFTLLYTTSSPKIPDPETVHSDKHRLSPTKAVGIGLHP